MADKPDVEPIYDRCVQFDSRFPNQNQSRNCFQNLLDYQRCVRLKGDDYEPCQYFKFAYRNICPSYYIQKMEELHEQRISFQRPPGARSWELHDLKF